MSWCFGRNLHHDVGVGDFSCVHPAYRKWGIADSLSFVYSIANYHLSFQTFIAFCSTIQRAPIQNAQVADEMTCVRGCDTHATWYILVMGSPMSLGTLGVVSGKVHLREHNGPSCQTHVRKRLSTHGGDVDTHVLQPIGKPRPSQLRSVTAAMVVSYLYTQCVEKALPHVTTHPVLSVAIADLVRDDPSLLPRQNVAHIKQTNVRIRPDEL